MDTQTETPTPPLPELPDGEYAIVECMGHATLIGRCMEVERFGTKMLQIEPIFGGKLLDPILQAGTSLYRFTPCSKAVALQRCPKHAYELPTPVRATLPPALLEAPATSSVFYDADEEPDEPNHDEAEDDETYDGPASRSPDDVEEFQG